MKRDDRLAATVACCDAAGPAAGDDAPAADLAWATMHSRAEMRASWRATAAASSTWAAESTAAQRTETAATNTPGTAATNGT